MSFTFGTGTTTTSTAPIRLHRPQQGEPIPCAGCGRTVAERKPDGVIVVRRGGVEHARIKSGEAETQCAHPPAPGRKPCRAFTVLRAGMPLPPTVTTSMAVPVVTSITVVDSNCTPLAEEPLARVA